MSLRTLDLNLLRVFDEVMKERSLTRAAGKLAMTQPAVSNAISRLRDALGDELVTRSGYGVEPTARASALWPAVREALTTLDKAIYPGTFQPENSTETFRLAMADATASVLVSGLVQILGEEAPGVSLRILPLTTRDPRTLLDNDQANVAIGYFPVASSAIKLHAMQDDAADAYGTQPIYQGPYVCIMRKNHPLARYKEISLDQFCDARHLLVSFSGRPFGFSDQSLAQLGRKRRVVMTVNQFFTAGQVVVKSDLLSVMPLHFIGATGFGDQLEIRPLPFKMDAASIDAVWSRRYDTDPAHRWLLEIISRSMTSSQNDALMPLSPGAQGIGAN